MQKITDFTKLKIGDRVLVKWKFNSKSKEGSSLIGTIIKLSVVPLGSECRISAASNLFSPGDVTVLTNELFNNENEKKKPGYKLKQAVLLTESEYNIHMI
jgi:hypothetical protein